MTTRREQSGEQEEVKDYVSQLEESDTWSIEEKTERKIPIQRWRSLSRILASSVDTLELKSISRINENFANDEEVADCLLQLLKDKWRKGDDSQLHGHDEKKDDNDDDDDYDLYYNDKGGDKDDDYDNDDHSYSGKCKECNKMFLFNGGTKTAQFESQE